MLNKTSSFYKIKEIDFKVMGLDERTSKVLNWAIEHFDNCEFMKESGFMDSQSLKAEVYFDGTKTIMKIEKPTVYKRT